MSQLRVQIGIFFIVIGLVGIFVTWNNYQETKFASYEYVVENSMIDEIIVNNRISSVEVLPTSELHIRVVWEVDGHKRESERVSIEEIGNRLEISADHERFFIGIPTFRFRQMQMKIYVPEKELSRLDVTNDVGSVQVKNIRVDELTVRTDVQRIYIHGVEAEKIDARSAVGAITIEKSSGDITAIGNVGRVLVDVDTVEGNMELQSDVGSVELVLENVPSNVSFIGSSAIGSVQIFGSRAPVLATDPVYEVYLQTEVGSVNVKTR